MRSQRSRRVPGRYRDEVDAIVPETAMKEALSAAKRAENQAAPAATRATALEEERRKAAAMKAQDRDIAQMQREARRIDALDLGPGWFTPKVRHDGYLQCVEEPPRVAEVCLLARNNVLVTSID